jgi:hypothetical protein
MDRINLSQIISLGNLFAAGQKAFEQLYLRGAIDANRAAGKPSGLKYL